MREGRWRRARGPAGTVLALWVRWGLGFTGAKGHGDNKQSSGWSRALARASLLSSVHRVCRARRWDTPPQGELC